MEFDSVTAMSIGRKPITEICVGGIVIWAESVNQNLNITSAKFQTTSAVSGKNATLSVTASIDAESLEILDSDGNLIELKAVKKQEKNGKIFFMTSWKVTGSRGDKLEYTVRVKDADGAVSVNQETVSITIK